MSWFSYTAEALWILVQCYMTWRLIHILGKERFRQGITVTVSIAASMAAAAVRIINLSARGLVSDSGVPTVISLIIPMIAIVLYKAEIVKLLQASLLVWEFARLWDYFVQTVLYGILENDYSDTRMFQQLGLPRTVLLVIYVLFIILVSIKGLEFIKKYLLSSWLMRWPGLIFSTAFWFLLAFLQRIYYAPKDMVTEGYLFVWQVVVLAAGMTLIVIWILLRRWKLQEENRLQQQRIEYMEKRHEQLLLQYQERRQMVHDIKNNYLTIRHYLEKEEYNNAKAYLEKLLPDKKNVGIYRYSGHEIIDMILNIKAESAKDEGIKCIVFSDDMTGLLLSDVEISSLFGNLLDNAIEAQKGKPDICDKWIEIQIRKKMKLIYIQIRNPYEGSITFLDGKPKTNKINLGDHGVGTLVVEKIVKKYHGALLIETEGQVYRVDIIMEAFSA